MSTGLLHFGGIYMTLLQTDIKDATSVVHKGAVYKICKGIAEVAEEAVSDLLSFPHWHHVTEEVSADVLAELHKPDPPKEPPAVEPDDKKK
jgi:hypothetical protein